VNGVVLVKMMIDWDVNSAGRIPGLSEQKVEKLIAMVAVGD
jgi:hypothetical protein